MESSRPTLKIMHGFWNTEACDTHVVERASDEADFYEK